MTTVETANAATGVIGLVVWVRPKLGDEARERVRQAVVDAGGRVYFAKEPDEVPQPPTIVFGTPSLEWLHRQPQVRWVQTASAGVDSLLLGSVPFPEHVVLTNASGVYGAAGAEHIVGMMLYFVRGFGFYLANQKRGRWVRDVSYAGLLQGKTLVILGLGDIGTNLARRARAFDMRVIGVKRTAGNHPNVERVVGVSELDEVLPLADHLAITLPLTRETRGLLDARRIGLLRPGTYVYNLGRGAIVDEEALVSALQTGHLGGAGLDVFTREPLPEDHPLWTLDNVIITPHLGADTPWDNDRAADIFIENLKRFAAGEALINVVDRERGY